MTSSSTTPFLSPEEIVARNVGEAAHIKFADLPSVFRERALRLRQLAAGHPMRDFLIFIADVADAQHAVLAVPRVVRLPSDEFLEEAARAGRPALQFPHWSLNDEWREDLRDLLTRIQERSAQVSMPRVMADLQSATADYLHQQAERLLSGIMLGLDLAAAPLIGAALQVYWARLVARTQAAFPDLAFGPIDNARVCPCCGSQPVASVLRLGGNEGTSRYLHCALCQTEWHMVRIKCAHCESTKGIVYEELEAVEDTAQSPTLMPKGAVKAECCDECGAYLKIMSMEKDQHVDPVADDLATVALDLLVSEAGRARHGINYMLLWGEPADEAQALENSPVRTP